MQQFAKELVAHQPDIILTQNTPSTAAMLRQTRSIPIIFGLVSDPVGSGFVASFSRPGGNVTGFVNFEGSVGGKWLELLKETAPRTNRVAFLFNPTTAPFATYYLDSFKAAARTLAVEAITAPVRDLSQAHQSQSRQSARPRSAADAARPRRRGDRIVVLFAAVHMSLFGASLG
jgi:putative tryptophan/tyrosine transport system substrate-binding protein